MNSAKDIIKNSFLEAFDAGNITFGMVLISLSVALALAMYLFFVYFMLEKKTFYDVNFSLSLVGMTVITAAIVLTIQSNLVLSLGMVGALSIVRYRSAVKDPMDLFFLFWGIANGIMSGARQYAIAILLSLVLTLVLLILSHIPTARAPHVLVVNAPADTCDRIDKIISAHCIYSKVRAKHITNPTVRMIVEIKTKEENDLLAELAGIDHVSASLLTYEGDIIC